ncbi:hypothetical protein CEXT_464021 [Caerostris extrusa]|uniref:Uncharacterized protein n=1 Tax=Caerostris extrusa TaxID=172846 RepID=A0AAV4M5R5_CAEEX|nr:hypothetical protein CEXT_464021 [Caerostris extrusa]
MHLSILATRATQKQRRATKAEFHPSPGSERTDLRSLRRCVPTTSYSMKLITRCQAALNYSFMRCEIGGGTVCGLIRNFTCVCNEVRPEELYCYLRVMEM